MEDIKNKLADKEAEQVSGGGGAVWNKGNISNPDKIFGGAVYNTKVYDGNPNPDTLVHNANHEFNYGINVLDNGTQDN